MASIAALRALLATTLGLGALDVAWLDRQLVPSLFAAPTAPSPAPAPIAEPSLASMLDTAPPVVPALVVVAELAERVDSVYFDRLSVDIAPAARDALATIARTATNDIVVIGHSDHRGDEEINRALRMRRAIAVRDHLALLGVSSDRVHVRAAEAGEPVDETEMWRDRRAEIHFTIPGGSR